MDAFFASVEQRDFPHLKGQPVVVGGGRDRRGVVAAASYEARRFGIHSAMSMGEAFRRCPHLHRQPVRMERYREVSLQVKELFHQVADRVEPLSIDEAFLDVTRTSRSRGITATRLAFGLKQEIARVTGLTASAGVAPNKFLAKIASDMQKPDGLTVVQPHEVEVFLDPLPVKKIWGVGPATADRLARLGIHTIKELRSLPLESALDLFGKSGLLYYRLSRGLDDRPVKESREVKSISTERTFHQDVRDPLVLREQLQRQCEEIAQRCARGRLVAGTVVLKLRYGDFETVTRSLTAGNPTRRTEELLEAAVELLERTDYRERPVRLLGVGVSGLLSDDRPRQLRLFTEES